MSATNMIGAGAMLGDRVSTPCSFAGSPAAFRTRSGRPIVPMSEANSTTPATMAGAR